MRPEELGELKEMKVSPVVANVAGFKPKGWVNLEERLSQLPK
ncbi:MAG: hypothetical protein V1703_02200 [Candidatus Altiarchaeota archaeon]